VTWRISTRRSRRRDGNVLRKANPARCAGHRNCERPVASVSRETAAEAPEIPAGHGPAVRPTSRDSCRFPGRLAVRRAARFWPAVRPTVTSEGALGESRTLRTNGNRSKAFRSGQKRKGRRGFARRPFLFL
jgi:hypothetical protein